MKLPNGWRAALIGLAIAGYCPQSSACPAPPDELVLGYLADTFLRSTLVARAIVVGARFDPTTKRETATIRLERMFKGRSDTEFHIENQVSMCVRPLPSNRRKYLFLAESSEKSKPTMVAHVRLSHAPKDMEDRLTEISKAQSK